MRLNEFKLVSNASERLALLELIKVCWSSVQRLQSLKKYEDDKMQSICFACDKKFFYREDDDDCSKFICSFCYSLDPRKMGGKWARLRFKILQRDGFACKYCGASPLKSSDVILHVDHVTPVCEIINNSEKNLLTSCSLCNFGKLGSKLNDKSQLKVKEYLENGKESNEVKVLAMQEEIQQNAPLETILQPKMQIHIVGQATPKTKHFMRCKNCGSIIKKSKIKFSGEFCFPACRLEYLWKIKNGVSIN